jgi:hypothetical protein
MSPREVQGLQALAENNGGSLTINPETGLPEAGFLDKLLPAIIGFGISAASGGTINPMQAAMIVGGVQTARTGDIGKGIQAGLGAYGGAGIGAGLSTAGESVLSGDATALAAQSAANLAGEQATQLGLDEAAKQQMIDEASNATARVASNASPFERLSAGTKAFGENPMGFANKENLKYLGMAASPILADLMVPTTTKQPITQSTDTINQSIYDPYSGTYRRLNPVPAANYGTPAHKGFAEGGIVALAHGGVPGYADGGFTDAQVKDWFLANKDANDKTIADAMSQFKVGTEQIARATGTQGREDEYNTRFVQQIAQPDTTSAQFLAKTADVGLQGQGLASALGSSGLSAASQYALTNADVGGLAGLSTNINKALTDPNLTLTKAQELMTASGTTDADVLRATGRNTADIFATRAADAEAKAAAERNAAAAAASKLSADRAAAEKLAADQAAAVKAAQEKAIADKAAADKLAADKFLEKFAADKTAAERAAAAKAAADKIAADKDIADKIAADDKAFADRAAAAKAALDAKYKKDADEKADAKIRGDAARAAYEKAEAEKAAREKAIADKIAADKAAEKAAAEKAADDAARKVLEDRVRTCPAPDMRILLANGDLKAAGELQIGDVVKTQHEHTLEWGEYPVTHVSVVPDATRLKFNFDSVDFVCSLDHKFFKAADKWVDAKDVCVGDMLSGQTVRGIEQAEVGDVIRITIDNAHTYICEGLLSHNKTPKPPSDADLAAAAAAAAKAKAEAEADAKAARDKIAADAAAAANTISTIGTVNLATDTGVTLDKTDNTTTGTNTLATTTPGSITSNITTDGQYIGTSGPAAVVGTKVGTGTISGTGTETTTGTTGPIIDYGGTAGFKVAPLTLAQTDLAAQTAATNAAQNTQLNLYRDWVTQNPNATDLQHANFLDKINLSPDVAARATPLSAQQMKNRYYDAKYNTQTGDSKAAYDYLMGKSAYPTKSGVGQIMRPYAEATLGMPANTNRKYIFDPITKSYKLNQDYVAGYKDSTGGTNYLMSPKEIYNYFVKNAGQADSVTYDWAIENNLTPEEIASATGVPLSTVAAKWRDAKAKKDSAAKDATKTVAAGANTVAVGGTNYDTTDKTTQPPEDNNGKWDWDDASKKWVQMGKFAAGGIAGFAMGGMPTYAAGGGLGALGSYSDGGRLLRGPGDGVSDSIPATIGRGQRPARLADGEFVVPARIVSELGNGSTEAGAKKLYAMMDRVQRARGKTTGKNRVAANSRADKYLPA